MIYQAVFVSSQDIEYFMEEWIKAGHSIVAVISSTDNLKNWIESKNKTSENKIELFKSCNDFDEKSKRNSIKFDFLFSIFNYTELINKEFLKLPEVCAINYHPAPLPKYRGSYGNRRAILNNDKTFCITWHLMEEKIDAGQIIFSEEFEISSDYNPDQLLMECSKQAQRSFPKIIDIIQTQKEALKNNYEIGLKNPKPVSSYAYKASDKFPGNGVINWNDPAEFIVDRLYRALTIEEDLKKILPNELGLTKVIIKDASKSELAYDVWYPKIITHKKMGDSSRVFKPGQVITINADYIEIATKEGVVCLRKIQDNKGIMIDSLHKYCDERGITIGSELPIFTQEEFDWIRSFKGEDYARPKINPHDQIDKYLHKIYLSEKYWVKALENCAANALGFEWKLCSQSTLRKIEVNLSLLSDNAITAQCIRALIAAYIYRLEPEGTLTIGYRNEREQPVIPAIFSALFSPVVPLTLSKATFNHGKNLFSDLETEIENQLKKHKEKCNTFCLDVKMRYAKLCDLHIPFAINLIVTQDIQKINFPLSGSLLTWVYDEKNKKFFVYYDIHAVPQEQKELLEHLMETQFPSQWMSLLNYYLKNNHSPFYHWLSKELITAYPVALENFKYSSSLEESGLSLEPFSTDKNKIAVITERKKYTYARLKQDADALSDRLIKKMAELKINKKEEKTILVLLPNKYRLTSLVGIQNAEGIYVPLDVSFIDTQATSEYTKSYLQHVLAITKSRLIVTYSKDKSKIEEIFKKITNNDFNQLQFLCIDEMQEQHSFEKPILRNELAYVIFTSGTTSQAKGVAVNQHAIAYSTAVRYDYYQNKPETPKAILTLTGPAFDATMGMMRWALSCGATWIGIEAFDVTNAKKIFNWIEKYSITHLVATPGLYANLLDYLAAQNKTAVDSLKAIILGGEPCSIELIEKSKKFLPHVWLFVEYGPTETCVWITVDCVYHPGVPIALQNRVPIGLPLTADIEFQVMSANQQFLPPGIPGELYISSPTLAKCYWNDTEKTKQKFVDKDQRVYFKTGDKVYYHPIQKKFFYKGRLDNELKINGRRVDLRAIIDCVQKISEITRYQLEIISTPKQKIVLALQVDENEETLPYLKRRIYKILMNALPYYLIPNEFIVCKKLPLTSNGKIDIKKISEIDKLGLQSYLDKLENFWYQFCCKEHALEISKEDFVKRLKIAEDLKEVQGLDSIKRTKGIDEFAEKYQLSTVAAHVILTRPTLDEQAKAWDYLAFPPALILSNITGFLGIHLFAYLWSHTEHKIYVLIRANSDEELNRKKEEIKNNLAKLYSSLKPFDTKQNSNRVEFIRGDISRFKWNLSKEALEKLNQQEITDIYHVAAEVNHLLPYDQLSDTNIDSVKTLVKDLAPAWHYPNIYFVSTLSAITHNPDQLKGYAKTKYEAEQILIEAREKNPKWNIHIFRPAWITGFPIEHMINREKDHFICLLKTFRKYLKLPQFDKNNVNLYFTPVDVLCEAILSVSKSKELFSQTFNMAYQLDWANLLKILTDLMPQEKFELHNIEDWIRALNVDLGQPECPLNVFHPLYEGDRKGLLGMLESQKTVDLEQSRKLMRNIKEEFEIRKLFMSIFDIKDRRSSLSFAANTNFFTPLNSQTKLYQAVLRSDYAEAERILDMEKDKSSKEKTIDSANFDERDNAGNTALHAAVYKNDHNIVELLINYGANVNKTNDNLSTPLYEAVFRHQTNIIKLLIKNKNLELKQRDKQHSDLLIMACWRDVEIDILKLILEKYKENQININIKNQEGHTPLYKAVDNGNYEAVKLLIQYGANILEKNGPYERTVLHHAVQKGNHKIVQLLCETAIAQKTLSDLLDAKQASGRTALSLAPKENVDQMRAYLKELKHEFRKDEINLDKNNLATMDKLFYAIRKDKKELIKEIIESNKRIINLPNAYGITPLYEAVFFQNEEIVDLFIKHDAKFNKQDKLGSTILIMACWRNVSVSLLRKIIENSVNITSEEKIDINDENKEKHTALYKAVDNGNYEAVKLLIQYGANIFAVNGPYKRTALHHAAQKGFSNIVELLCEEAKKQNKLLEFLEKPQSMGRTAKYLVTKNQEVEDLLKKYAEQAHGSLAHQTSFVSKQLVP